MNTTLLVYSQNAEDYLFAREAARSLGIGIHVAIDVVDALQQIQAGLGRVLFFYGVTSYAEVEEFEKVFLPHIGQGPDQLQPEFVHLIYPLDELQIDSRTMSGFGSFLVREKGNPKAAGTRYGALLKPVISKLLNFDQGEPVEAQATETVYLQSSAAKVEVLREIETLLLDRGGFHASLAASIVTAVDELLMNAFYDAPTCEQGRQLLESTPRSVPVILEKMHEVELRIRLDKEYASITVTDRFGTLERENVLRHVLRDLNRTNYRVDASRQGAGIGLATTFHMGGSLLFRCDSGKKTEVTALFKKTESVREFRKQFRFVSVYVSQARGQKNFDEEEEGTPVPPQ